MRPRSGADHGHGIRVKVAPPDAHAATTESQLRRAQASRQSILRAAFAGQLVPQNPSDEAATALLDRIATARGAGTAEPKRGPKTKIKERA
jgi:type I restriction enzyme, S subunit